MMLDAYRALANSAHRPFVDNPAIEVEKALESIQLLGTATVEMTIGLLLPMLSTDAIAAVDRPQTAACR